MNNYAKHLRNRMMMSRLLGILACLIAIAGIVLRFLEILSPWLCIISIAYAMAIIFGFNSNLQDIRVGNPWQRINALLAVLMFALVIFLIVYGFVSGELEVQF